MNLESSVQPLFVRCFRFMFHIMFSKNEEDIVRLIARNEILKNELDKANKLYHRIKTTSITIGVIAIVCYIIYLISQLLQG